jgi:hypothetical protein
MFIWLDLDYRSLSLTAMLDYGEEDIILLEKIIASRTSSVCKTSSNGQILKWSSLTRGSNSPGLGSVNCRSRKVNRN